MYEHLDRFPIRNGLAVGSSLIGQFTSNAAASGIVVVDKLVGVRLNGRGANSVTYPTMLTIGSNSKLFGAQYSVASLLRLWSASGFPEIIYSTVVKCQNSRPLLSKSRHYLSYMQKKYYCNQWRQSGIKITSANFRRRKFKNGMLQAKMWGSFQKSKTLLFQKRSDKFVLTFTFGIKTF